VRRFPLDRHGQGLEVGDGAHSPHLEAGHFLFDVLETLALRLRHAEQREEEGDDAHHTEDGESASHADEAHQVSERLRHHEGAQPVEGCGQGCGRTTDTGCTQKDRFTINTSSAQTFSYPKL